MYWSTTALRVLGLLGLEASSAAGHSLGELTALHWAGAMSEAALLRAATVRGDLMGQMSESGGAMASLTAPPADIEAPLSGEPAVIAGYNGPAQTVVSGPSAAVGRVCAAAVARGLTAARLNVSHAFHSSLVTPPRARRCSRPARRRRPLRYDSPTRRGCPVARAQTQARAAGITVRR